MAGFYITDYDMNEMSERMKEAVWRIINNQTSPKTKDVLTAGEVSRIASDVKTAVNVEILRLRQRQSDAERAAKQATSATGGE